MSQENVKVVRALFEAWNAGDMSAAGRCSTTTSCGGRPRVGLSRGRLWVARL